MVSSTKDLFRLSTLLTIVSALSILLAALPLLSLLPHTYVMIVLIVFAKILLIFSVTDYSLRVKEPRPFSSFAQEFRQLYVGGVESIKGHYVAIDAKSLAVFNEVMVYILAFPAFS